MWFDGEVLESEGYGAENGNDLPLGEVITHANRGSRVCALAHYEQHEVVHPPVCTADGAFHNREAQSPYSTRRFHHATWSADVRTGGAAAQRAGGDYPELFATFFAQHDITLQQIDLDQGRLPDDLDAMDGWITTGSAHSMVVDDLPWLADALDLVRTLVAENRPYIGDCFGHQLLGRALGGTVERTSLFRVGVQNYRVTARRRG